MTQAGQGDTVKIHYTGKPNDGAVFDSSREKPPMEFTLGQLQLIPWFENAVVGTELGETKIKMLKSPIRQSSASEPSRDLA